MDESGQRYSHDFAGNFIDCLLSIGLVSMNHKIIIVSSLMFLALLFISSQVSGSSSRTPKVSHERLVEFAECITKKGWAIYSSFTCSACRAQQELFGQTIVHLKIIECNPHAPHTQVEQCLKKNIRHTPTWVMEKNGKEVKRSKGYKEFDDLASMTGCEL